MTHRKTDDDPNGLREFQSDEVDALTVRANELLDELHDVMGEMAQRLHDFLGGEQP